MAARKGIGNFRRSYEATLCVDDEVESNINPLHLIISKQNASYFTKSDNDKTFMCAIRVKRNGASDTMQLLSPSSDSDSHTTTDTESTTSSSPATATSVLMSEDIIVCVWALDEPTHMIPPQKQGDSPLSIDGDAENEDNEADNDTFEDEMIPLHCTNKFLSHYNVSVRDLFYIRGIKMFPLTTAIFSVSNTEAYTWLQEDKFRDGLLQEISDHKVLVRQNDVLLAPYPELFLKDEAFNKSWYMHIKAIACAPFQIGVITDTTEIIFFLDKAIARLPSDHRHLSGARIEQYIDMAQSNLYLSDFCRGTVNESSSQSKSLTQTEVNSGFSDFFLSGAIVIQQVIHWKKVLLNDENFEKLDLTSVLGVPKKLMRNHGIRNGTIVKVTLYPKEFLDEVKVDDAKKYLSQERPNQKYVKVHSLSDRLDETDRVFISSMLLFNLQKFPPVKRSPLLIIEVSVCLFIALPSF